MALALDAGNDAKARQQLETTSSGLLFMEGGAEDNGNGRRLRAGGKKKAAAAAGINLFGLGRKKSDDDEEEEEGEVDGHRRLVANYDHTTSVRESMLSSLYATWAATSVTETNVASTLGTLRSIVHGSGADESEGVTLKIANGALQLLEDVLLATRDADVDVSDTAASGVADVLTYVMAGPLFNATTPQRYPAMARVITNATSIFGVIRQAQMAQSSSSLNERVSEGAGKRGGGGGEKKERKKMYTSVQKKCVS